ncbi:putative membrane protein [Candidatus Protochlamydia amoebophila]|uniref:TerC/Alx family metal homeostasis membrane protein n=1 Tax=Candidatus Protochlamydia amoebophila TaxID=362787 RepID=UPI001BC8E3AD|nr:TerC/Alx family metal homeostasis membrane protein [Candidatus Protochlamydia amoebophila]MBS4163699.1 putative membrane protein [Candidatus Protochlamydia amoebophila]
MADSWHWIFFNVFILLLLALDLYHFYYKPHSIKFKEAVLTSVGWVAIAFLFNAWLYYHFGSETAINFFTGYLLEKSLSVDNLFIFLLLFTHFKVPDDCKHRVLFYGVLGAIFMRGLLIWGGVSLVQQFDWMFYLFGLFLIYTGIKMGLSKEINLKLEENRIYLFLKKTIGMTSDYHAQSFFVKIDGKWIATPLFLVVLLIEFADLVFAIDSIPAILGITTDPFIVYTSNVLAILGLRSLFFVLEGMMQRFYLLHYALAFILTFIGFKMLLANLFHIPTFIALGILLLALLCAVIGSFLFPISQAESKQNEKQL